MSINTLNNEYKKENFKSRESKSLLNENNVKNLDVEKKSKSKEQKNHFQKLATGNNPANANDVLKVSLIKYFSDKTHIDRFLPIINRTSPVSLRLLDYFCVNYTRSNQVVYMIQEKYFDVHSSYKNQLKTFSKKLFDPFKRNSRVTIRYENDKFDTTLGQLCFFKWCLTHNVLDYVEKHIVAISDDMKKNSTKMSDDYSQTEKKQRSSRRRSTMNFTATRISTGNDDTIIVSFD